MYYAHSANGDDRWQELTDHLRNVAERARCFASEFGGGDLAHWLGIWHDIGKFSDEFQAYLCGLRPRGEDHKGAGTLLAMERAATYLPALLIQGHHGGLRSELEFAEFVHLAHSAPHVAVARDRAERLVPDLHPIAPIALPDWLTQKNHEFFLRMLFSALVDADYLDTEKHFNRRKTARRNRTASMADLWERMDQNQKDFLAGLPDDVRDTPLNRLRREIYDTCVEAAACPPGLFRLTVPTGGGKTRSGMAFALRHAALHGKKRVIVATPFIAITIQSAGAYRAIMDTAPDDATTEQSTDVYRRILGDSVVLEHHSGVSDDVDPADYQAVQNAEWNRLASENWNAPVIVTTMVQFFESLFGNSTPRCRRIHNIANSVVILDEVQCLPPGLLQTLLDGLRELCAHYGTTVVLSTATQPRFHVIPSFAGAAVTDIIPDPARYFTALRRVDYVIDTDAAKSWEEVADIMRSEPRCLAIVNIKRHAAELLATLADPEALHLSTRMCGAHRQVVLAKIKQLLKDEKPCRVVSTQVVEAGVDIDFPVVLRARGPLDSIIQAAGRCNREGKLPGLGRVIVFRPLEECVPKGYYHTATEISIGFLAAGRTDLNDPVIAEEYYEHLFTSIEPDAHGIQGLREDRDYPDYPEIAKRCRLIKDNTESVIITDYGTPEQRAKIQQWIADLQVPGANKRQLLRNLQPFMVSLMWYKARDNRPLITRLLPGIGIWRRGFYHDVYGIVLPR